MVVSDNIITAGGKLSAIDLAQKIIEICYSPTNADVVLDYIERHKKHKGLRLDLGEPEGE